MLFRSRFLPGWFALYALVASATVFWLDAAEPPPASPTEERLLTEYRDSIRSVLVEYCLECHSSAVAEADVDLEVLGDETALNQFTDVLLRVLEQVRTEQMPPPDAPQLSEEVRQNLNRWLREWLRARAERDAGDPGPVVLRRLNNAEYTYTIRDLTGVPNLQPAREFPTDSAAGEGFSNTGASLVMSPSLVEKYLAAAKEISNHAVLLPRGIRFAADPSPSDVTNDLLNQIRNFYARYTASDGGETVNLQGIVFETNQGGRLPIERYLTATLEVRDRVAPANGSSPNAQVELERVAEAHGLNLQYLRSVWHLMTETAEGEHDLIRMLATRWRTLPANEVGELSAEMLGWQQALWKFSSVGHIGKKDGPRAWQEPVDPIGYEQPIRMALPEPAGDSDAVFYLTVSDAGDGSEDDVAWLERPRLVSPGRPEILLRDLSTLSKILAEQQRPWSRATRKMLGAMVPYLESSSEDLVTSIASEHQLPPELVRAWATYLGLASGDPDAGWDGKLLTQRGENLSGYEFIDGWVAEDALSVIANASDDAVRVPGNMPPRTVGVHPSPTQGIGIGWSAPEGMAVHCSGWVRHAHTECGNGIAWRLELHRGWLRQVLATGSSNGATAVPFDAGPALKMRAGDSLHLIVEPRDGNHSCDLTNIDLEIRSEQDVWRLSSDVGSDILAGNPHADRQGRPGIWRFYSQAVLPKERQATAIPSGSLLARWFHATDAVERDGLAAELERLLSDDDPATAIAPADAELLRQLRSARGPFFLAALESLGSEGRDQNRDTWELAPVLEPISKTAGAILRIEDGILIRGSESIKIRVPAALALETEFVTTGRLHPTSGPQGSVQIHVSPSPPVRGVTAPSTSVDRQDPNWTTPSRRMVVSAPILVAPGGVAEQRIRRSFDTFRTWFPLALCYPKIVPVDEVVTLTLFYREDEPLRRLMLGPDERETLESLWEDLHFVSQDALKLVDAYEQLWQYATQDADPSAFEPLREPIYQRADLFRRRQLVAEPLQLAGVIEFAERAFRGSWSSALESSLRRLYQGLRDEGMEHADAIRFLIARVLVSPQFLYRLETPVSGSAPGPVSAIELANRLSYFLWSSMPDAELISAANDGSLLRDETIEVQVRRMLQDPRCERIGVEFGAMWLQIRDLDQLDEKSDSHFPEFRAIREDLYREAILLVSELFQRGGSVLDLLDADHSFLNERLAQYYGIPGVEGDRWRRVEGVRRYHRGGVLGLGATLAKQSGASRTSPILRGTWLSDVILGEKLPKPPKNVPVLSELPPEGVSERELIERHSSDPACAKCHRRIDPFGFALEGFDAIGRYRERDSSDLAVDTSTVLPDGTALAGMESLRRYLSTDRREDFLRQFDRKLLGYALGRAVQLSDEPFLESLRAWQSENEYDLTGTVVRVALSPAFRNIRGQR